MLLEDYESRNTRLQEVMVLIEELVRKIPMAEKLLEIKGVGIRTVSGFLAEVGDISRFKQLLSGSSPSPFQLLLTSHHARFGSPLRYLTSGYLQEVVLL